MLHDGACRATRRDGQRCRSTIVLPSGCCPMPDPARQAEVTVARARGGHHKGRTARLDRLVPGSLKPVLAALIAALHEVHGEDGQPPTLSPAQASAMASLAGAVVKVYQVGVLEERVEALEAAQDAPGRRGA